MRAFVDHLGSAMGSRVGRAVALTMFAILAAFLAGYVLVGPVALNLLPE
jgi:hypothetical protein